MWGEERNRVSETRGQWACMRGAWWSDLLMAGKRASTSTSPVRVTVQPGPCLEATYALMRLMTFSRSPTTTTLSLSQPLCKRIASTKRAHACNLPDHAATGRASGHTGTKGCAKGEGRHSGGAAHPSAQPAAPATARRHGAAFCCHMLCRRAPAWSEATAVGEGARGARVGEVVQHEPRGRRARS